MQNCIRLIVALMTFTIVSSVLYAETKQAYAIVDIDRIGNEKLLELQNTPGLSWWVELDHQLLILAPNKVIANITKSNSCKKLAIEVVENRLYFIQRAHSSNLEGLPVDILAKAGRFAVVQSQTDAKPELRCCITLEGNGDAFSAMQEQQAMAQVHAIVKPFKGNSVLVRQTVNNPRSQTVRAFSATIRSMVDKVSGERWHSDVEKLASFSRYTHGEDIKRSRDWLIEQYKSLPGFEVTTVDFRVGSTTTQNVVATLRGTTKADDFYVVGAHYDSISPNPHNQAPGAEDNASGSAAVLEMARIFSQHRPKATIMFMHYSGEEQGLYGSKKHVSDLIAKGQKGKFKSILTMDMIGFTNDSDLDCLLETGQSGKHLLDVYAQAAREYTTLRTVNSLNPFGSDHVPYLNQGMSAILIIENDWDDYPAYHKTNDLPSFANKEQGEQIIRMNVAVIAEMTGAE